VPRPLYRYLPKSALQEEHLVSQSERALLEGHLGPMVPHDVIDVY